MSYHVYTTDGLILRRTPFGEANVVLHILTKDFGLIIASAQGVRLPKSKLCSVLQEYALITVSCVKGKNGWKITNAVEKENLYFSYPEYTRKVMSQIVSVLMKMIPGESRHPEIYDVVVSALTFLKSTTKDEINNFEILLMLRILYLLGYVGNDEKTKVLLDNTNEWKAEIFEIVKLNKANIVFLINKALRESHL